MAVGVEGYELREEAGANCLFRPDGSLVVALDWSVPPEMQHAIAKTDAEVQRLFREEDMRLVLGDFTGHQWFQTRRMESQLRRRDALEGKALADAR